MSRGLGDVYKRQSQSTWNLRASRQLWSAFLALTQLTLAGDWTEKLPRVLLCLLLLEKQAAGRPKEHRTPRTWKAEWVHGRPEAGGKAPCVQGRKQDPKDQDPHCSQVGPRPQRGLGIS